MDHLCNEFYSLVNAADIDALHLANLFPNIYFWVLKFLNHFYYFFSFDFKYIIANLEKVVNGLTLDISKCYLPGETAPWLPEAKQATVFSEFSPAIYVNTWHHGVLFFSFSFSFFLFLLSLPESKLIKGRGTVIFVSLGSERLFGAMVSMQ